MTVVYLQCTNPECLGLGTRSRARERCKCCGQMADKKGEEFACNLCGHTMRQVTPTTWDQLRKQVWTLESKRGQPRFPTDA